MVLTFSDIFGCSKDTRAKRLHKFMLPQFLEGPNWTCDVVFDGFFLSFGMNLFVIQTCIWQNSYFKITEKSSELFDGSFSLIILFFFLLLTGKRNKKNEYHVLNACGHPCLGMPK